MAGNAVSTQLNILLGGAGLVGTALDRALNDRGEETKVYDLKTGVDLREYEPEDFGPDTYYWFLAWDVGGAKYIMDDSQQLSILRHNLDLCHRVFGWLEKRNARYSFVSSQMVGYPNAYGVTKAVGETWAKLVGRGLITRLWNCYDAEEPAQRSHVIPDLLVQARSGTIRLLTSGEERRQFLHADDVARALIFQRDTGQPLADVTSGDWVSVRDVAETIGRQLSAQVVVDRKRGYESLVEPSHWLQGWQPAIDLAAGLAKVIERMKSNRWM
jgi:nucleoside-diphosphate-sugar epimerase